MKTRVRRFHAIGVDGERWFVEYEYAPGQWQRLTDPFRSEEHAESWRRAFAP